MIKINRKIWFPILVWISLFVFIFNMANYFQPPKYALLSAAYEILSLLIMYYITTRYLFPRFYKNNKEYLYISVGSIICIATVFFFIDINFIPNFDRIEHERPPAFFHFTRYILSLGFTFFVATSVSLMEQTAKLKESEKILTAEKLETELKLLKAQINPHFIFNALNNIYSLTYMQSKNAPDSVLKLSEMLRYVFYDCSKDRVLLSAELKYIENFNAFQQMKSEFSQNISFQTEVNGENIEIAPMLFIPFIENAFKYSRVEESDEARVNISIKLNDVQLHFSIENTVPVNKPSHGSGMGIKNVRHRLDIIYPGKYELNIDEQTDFYKVDLKLEV